MLPGIPLNTEIIIIIPVPVGIASTSNDLSLHFAPIQCCLITLPSCLFDNCSSSLFMKILQSMTSFYNGYNSHLYIGYVTFEHCSEYEWKCYISGIYGAIQGKSIYILNNRYWQLVKRYIERLFTVLNFKYKYTSFALWYADSNTRAYNCWSTAQFYECDWNDPF